jgi:hypothetical protein
MLQFRFRVTKISFYIEIPRRFRHLLIYTTKPQSHGKKNAFPRYTTVALVEKPQVKRTSLNLAIEDS